MFSIFLKSKSKLKAKMMLYYLVIILLPVAALSLLKDQPHSTRLLTTTRAPTSISLATESNYDGTQPFPIATLLENAKEIDANLANGARLGKYSESTWSNRLVNCGSLQSCWCHLFFKIIFFRLTAISAPNSRHYILHISTIKKTRDCIDPGSNWSLYGRPSILLE